MYMYIRTYVHYMALHEPRARGSVVCKQIMPPTSKTLHEDSAIAVSSTHAEIDDEKFPTQENDNGFVLFFLTGKLMVAFVQRRKKGKTVEKREGTKSSPG